MRNNLPKITLLFVIGTIIYSCSLVKRVPEGKQLLSKNEIFVNEKLIKEERINNLVLQQPNNKFLAYPLRLSLYNLAKKNPDSSYQVWLNKKPNRRARLVKLLSEKQIQRLGNSFVVSGFNNFLKKTGEPPVIIDTNKAEISKERLSGFYYNNGFLKNNVTLAIDSVGNKKGKITYRVETGKPYHIDTISRVIETPAIDSLFASEENKSFLKKGAQYSYQSFDNERKRITQQFRNNGVYHFQENHVKFDAIIDDSIQKMNVVLKIEDRNVKEGDTLIKKPFTIYKISQVNIFTNNTSKKEKNNVKDSAVYNNYNIYSSGRLNYKPKALTNAVFIEKGKLFSDNDRTLTSKALSNLKVFNYPNIEYTQDPADSTNTSLIANIYLVNKPKFKWTPSIDVSTSDVQEFGISGNMSFTWRNVFKRAEILELSTRGNIGSSQDLANPNNVFFNISEYGADAKLNFPRIFFPISVKNIIKKEMFPSTQISTGITNQRNIGLDKQSLSSSISYSWSTNNNKNNFKFELLGINYVRNLNVGNYFNVYRNSYNRINEIAAIYNTNGSYEDANGDLREDSVLDFIVDVLSETTALTQNDADFKSVLSISERYVRLAEDNLIVSSSFVYNRTTKNNINDRNYYNFKAKIESAGNLLSFLGNSLNLSTEESTAGNTKLFGIEYAQYIKSEVDFVKHWDFGKKNTLAMRSFAGIAIPYGNAKSIPFSRSYFSGGSNDNRGWQAYSLGPGRSGGVLDFNEANLKLAFSTEYRFRVGGNLYSALFVDVGNIWNVLDNVEDERYTFTGLKSLQDLAVGSGIGFRYDFDFFVFRFDLGYKTYDPAREIKDRWFKGINFSKTVLNFGINYPF
ncbi:MAG TPA: BamA/TamA family outer membrane protein [Flavobacterium sp.]|uniref:translocation and assembly module lipoprotein TamL n=1 Tax=Flavobacterium sp. TaxID=239 RepID=UPI002B4B3DF7|nr:BamA/TamA family outer membrane protein [Flavobacterium sp.]HLO73999.1 BamA/TamA family outer membrane protein [Flavobacterium sp.]